jgi:hypothetical protein
VSICCSSITFASSVSDASANRGSCPVTARFTDERLKVRRILNGIYNITSPAVYLILHSLLSMPSQIELRRDHFLANCGLFQRGCQSAIQEKSRGFTRQMSTTGEPYIPHLEEEEMPRGKKQAKSAASSDRAKSRCSR